jgi:hypothetical protein
VFPGCWADGGLDFPGSPNEVLEPRGQVLHAECAAKHAERNGRKNICRKLRRYAEKYPEHAADAGRAQGEGQTHAERYAKSSQNGMQRYADSYAESDGFGRAAQVSAYYAGTCQRVPTPLANTRFSCQHILLALAVARPDTKPLC